MLKVKNTCPNVLLKDHIQYTTVAERAQSAATSENTWKLAAERAFISMRGGVQM